MVTVPSGFSLPAAESRIASSLDTTCCPNLDPAGNFCPQPSQNRSWSRNTDQLCHGQARYRVNMTVRLEEAINRVASLSAEEQDAIASQILETLDDEEALARSFRERPELLRSLAREALEEHRRGETRPLDELLR